MTQEEKQLLLKDLCARLPYGVILNINNGKYREDKKIWPSLFDSDSLWDVKPYLRSMSSMTEKERREYCNECNKVLLMRYRAENHYPVTDWLLSHHFDFRRLISMSLALEAPAGMYNTE